MRTIEAPGVEIREIDKSQYAPAIVGTAALVMGFANKGEDYTAMEMTSRSAWVNYYGEPDNEAERYFYTACMEVINQNGKLYCAKIPYENEARDKYVVKKYTISTRLNSIKSVSEYVYGNDDETANPSIMNLLSGNFTNYGYGIMSFPGIEGESDRTINALSTYAMTVLNMDEYYKYIKLWNQKRNLKSVALPTFFKYTETAEDDNWWYFTQTNTFDRLLGLFDPESTFWTQVAPSAADKIFHDSSQIRPSLLNLNALNEQIQHNGDVAQYQPYIDEGRTDTFMYEPLEYVKAFRDGFIETFGNIKDNEPWNFVFAKLNSTPSDDDSVVVVQNYFQTFIADNAALFDEKINRIVKNASGEFFTSEEIQYNEASVAAQHANDENFSLSSDEQIKAAYDPIFSNTDIVACDDVPYLYTTDLNHTNLFAYFTATKNVLETAEINVKSVLTMIKNLNILNDVSCVWEQQEVAENGIYSTRDVLNTVTPIVEMDVITKTDVESSPFIDFSEYDNGNVFKAVGNIVVDPMAPEEYGISQAQLTEIVNALENYTVGKYSDVYRAQKAKFCVGKNVSTEYVKDLLNFYATNVNVTSFYDVQSLYKDGVITDVLKTTKEVRLDENDNVVEYPDMCNECGHQGEFTSDACPVCGSLNVQRGIPQEVVDTQNVSFFEKYGNVVDVYSTEYLDELAKVDARKAQYLKLASETNQPIAFDDQLEALVRAFNKTLTKTNLISYIKKIRQMEEFKDIDLYLKKSPTTADVNTKFSVENVEDELVYSEIRDVDNTIKEYFTLRSNNNVFTLPLSSIDEYKTDEDIVPPNSIYIADMTRSRYVRSMDINETECIGIMPVITTAANALVAQSIIEEVAAGKSYSVYQPLSSVATLPYSFKENKKKHIHREFVLNGNLSADVVTSYNDPIEGKVSYSTPYNIEDFLAREIYSDDPEIETVSQEAAGYFSTIQYDDTGKLDRENMYDIGVIVFKMYLDASEGNKISFSAVESFVGSLDREAVNPNTGVTKFIDTIVNSQSEYINVFSNCYANDATRKAYDKDCDILIVEPQKAGNLGFYEDMCVEDISLPVSIYDGLNKVFDKNQDINEKEIDIVCDAGLSNIAQFIKSVYGKNKGKYDPASTEASLFKLKGRADTLTWRDIIQRYDNFCKNVRKDCMFIADGLRPFCLQGQKKIVRPTKPANSIDTNLLPYIKYMTGLNTNYGAGYCDWFQKADEFTGEYFWCPPSIQAMGIYIYTDVHAEYWDAPAGLNRGIVPALDVAFSPTIRQAGTIYNNNWNYAINYPQDGIVLEGQKTFQVKPSAFDRVNVRRLFLRLERATYKVARYFVYEGNTAYTRQRLIDTIDPIFADVKLRNGIYDYKIICDESINTPDVIDRNELKVKIGIKPVKTAEFILIDFIALSTGGSFDEM